MTRLSSQTPMIEEEDVEKLLKGNDATLLTLMRLITKHVAVAEEVCSPWERNFLADVAKKSEKFRNQMTPKQRETALKVLTKGIVKSALVGLLNLEEENEQAEAPAAIEETVAAPVDYLQDEEWGRF